MTIDRKAALVMGLPRYFTGVPCKRGHTSERFTTSKTCVSCEALKRREKPGRSTAWARANKDKVVAQKQRWDAENPGRAKRLVMEWKKNNPEARRVWNARRRSKGSATFGVRDIRELLEQQSHTCAAPWCGASLADGYHADHILPFALGGATSRGNLQLLCPPCNFSKHAKHPTDWWREHGYIFPGFDD